jgi:two-component system NtrC family sensor kinase
MSQPAAYSVAHVRALQDRLRGAVQDATALDAASQSFAQTMAEEFKETVLARVFSTIAFRILPEATRTFVSQRAREARIESLMKPELPVLALMGTFGVEPEWRQRAVSKRHLGIPLASEGFTRSLPMISALLSQVGFDPLRSREETRGIRIDQLLGGGGAGVFHVEDARSSVDPDGRKIIPAQDFVAKYGVRTVYGMGGCWPDGSFVTCIVFTRELLDRATIRRVAPVLSVFRAVTTPLVARGRYFAE